VVWRGELVVVVVMRWWWRWAELGAAVKNACQDLPGLGWLPALACSRFLAFSWPSDGLCGEVQLRLCLVCILVCADIYCRYLHATTTSCSSIGCYIRCYSAACRCFLYLFACLVEVFQRAAPSQHSALSARQAAGNNSLTQAKAIAADTSRRLLRRRFHWTLDTASYQRV
jgi:hypothetical protein